jgi:predicted O-methyltransferase YrrM
MYQAEQENEKNGDSSFVKDFDNCFTKIIEVFTELGYPQKLIEQWTLPQQDARTIVEVIQEWHPRNILEVGTFVGLTTLLLALVSPSDTHIHTIDPNFPLQIEMGAMRSRIYDSDADMRTQELALQAAKRLEVEDKITFHTGGFSTANTFATYNTDPSSMVQIVGPKVCGRHGPFDFIFIDGLHYEEDVYSDVNLAAEHLMSPGLIALHDVMGPWGSNVRRAVYRFLDHHDEFSFSHDKFSKVNDNIGFLQKYQEKHEKSYKQSDIELRYIGLIQEKIFSNLGAILIKMLSPANIIQMGGNIKLLEQLVNMGMQGECAYGSFSDEDHHPSIPIRPLSLQERNHFDKKYDLCLFFEIMDTTPTAYIDNIIQASIDSSDIIVFASSPPGEMGKYRQNNRPISYWTHKYFEKGYLFYDIIRPIMEPINYSDVLISDYDHLSSYLMDLYLVKKEEGIGVDKVESKLFEEIVKSKERRIEDILLQNLYQKCVLRQRRQLEEVIERISKRNKELVEEIDRINIFNSKVIRNTLNRIREIFGINRDNLNLKR